MKIERVVIAGIFSLDGADYEVENNVWLVGGDDRVVVIDAPHDAAPIVAAIAGRRVDGIVCTHGHNDHVNAAVDLAARAGGAPIALHPDDEMLWDVVHPSRRPDMALSDGQVLDVGGTHLRVMHTPGHSPGGVCLYVAEAGVVFSGDTLFSGGPGATGRSYSDFPTIIESIRTRMLLLPPDTVVHTGHGPSTTIGTEAPHLQEWIDRGP